MTDISHQFQTLGLAIEFARQNHRVIGQNLANINTPNYKTVELSFDDLLEQIKSGAKDTQEPGALEFATRESKGQLQRSDGNNVDMDKELAKIKKNAMAYQTLTQLLGSKIGMLQRAISG